MFKTKLIKIFFSIVVIGYLISTAIWFYPDYLMSIESQRIYERNCPPTIQRSNFVKSLAPFPWKLFNETAFDANFTNHYVLAQELLNQLVPFVIMEPLVPINETCKPRPFKKLNCSKVLQDPRKVAVLLQFGFDVDNLEIHFNELNDIVDRFFILESYRAHYGALKKPLVWEIVKNQARFEKFLPKVVHLILDDSDMVGVVKGIEENRTVLFEMEKLHEKIRWEKFLAWNNLTGYFGDDDLIGFGDTDEIPCRDAINQLKNCELEKDPVDIGIWFPFGNINRAFRPDYPVSKQHPFTLGDPAYWRLKTAKTLMYRGQNITRPYPSRNRGLSPDFLLGGMHMSHYGYLPYQILKRITQTERSLVEVNKITLFFQEYLKPSKMTLFQFEQLLADVPEEHQKRMFYLEELRRFHNVQNIYDIAILPWFYDCNRLRYPSWEGKHDTRLD